MKIAVVCKSDSNGGAAVVSRRLTDALRSEGYDATLLVTDKKTADPYVVRARFPLLRPLAFLAERLQIFLSNGFSRKNLFKADTGAFGLPLYRLPEIREADTVILNWVNQGTLSLKGIEKICRMGKNVIWIMHDMWNLTGICHHAMECRRFTAECGNCRLLGRHASGHDLSYATRLRKKRLYTRNSIRFVAVSNWLKRQAEASSLLGGQTVDVIPNPFNFKPLQERTRKPGERKKILFAAATLDNWIKGIETFKKAVGILADKYPETASETEIRLVGEVKNTGSIEGFRLPACYLGTVSGEEALAAVFGECDVVVNCSHFENLPGVLVEGQAYGSVPVAFDRGGQSDIIDHLDTGYLAAWDDDEERRAANIAEGMAWALAQPDDIRRRMRKKAEEKFAAKEVVKKITDIGKLF